LSVIKYGFPAKENLNYIHYISEIHSINVIKCVSVDRRITMFGDNVQYLIVRICLLTLFTKNTTAANSETSCDMNSLEFGKRLEGHAFQVLLEVSVEQCCEHCSSRPRCSSINYQRRFKLCELNDNATMDGQSLELVEDSEYVFANVQVSMSLIIK